MKTRRQQRIARKRRIRAKVAGTAQRPRLSFYRSSRALVVQVVDDTKGATLFGKRAAGTNASVAYAVGEEVAAAAKKKKISVMVFDRGGNRYHGVVAAFADAVRKGGVTI